MIKAITFDLWNTVIKNKFYSNERINFFLDILKKKNIDLSYETIKNAFEKVFYFHDINLKEIKYRHMHTKERLENLLNFLDLELNKKIKEEIKEQFESILLQDPPELRKGVKETLKKLSENYKIGLISNTGVTPGPILSKALEKRGILKYFDSTSYSDEIGVYKPHKRIFKETLKNLQCKPKQSIHIGDILETDIQGAKRFGMKAILIRDSKFENPHKIEPDYEIFEIPEVIEIVREIEV
ncbi:MAG: HAD family hydrolase [Promethearchaeota archaeon]|nr:MAG: HAD family hydrolase [Candidatus Lokiarchaeota archaeon]